MSTPVAATKAAAWSGDAMLPGLRRAWNLLVRRCSQLAFHRGARSVRLGGQLAREVNIDLVVETGPIEHHRTESVGQCTADYLRVPAMIEMDHHRCARVARGLVSEPAD